MWPLRHRAMWCYSGLVRWLCVLFFCDGDSECRVVVRDSLQLRKEPCEALWNFTCSHGREEGESETKSKICSVVLIWLDDKMTHDTETHALRDFQEVGKGGQCWPPESPDVPPVAKDAICLIPPLIFIFSMSLQPTSLSPKCACTPTSSRFPCPITPTTPPSMSLPSVSVSRLNRRSSHSAHTLVWDPAAVTVLADLPTVCSLQGLLERLHADWRGGRGARRLHHHLRRPVRQTPLV